MGFVGSLLGGGSGAGFQAAGADPGSANKLLEESQSGLQQQQDFLNAIQQQNGLQNQSNVFQQQQGLANQLQGVANGTGPNPALAQLNQATGQNVANQAALMAGQRGAGANVGLMARQAGQQGANTQQQAAGQGATLQAQQQLAGMQQLQNQQASMGNLANTQVGQQQNALNAYNQTALQGQSNLLGMQQNVNNANAGIAGGNAGMQGNLLSGVMGGVGAALAMADGGEVKKYANGGISLPNNPLMQAISPQQVVNQSGPQSNVGKFFSGMNNGTQPGQSPQSKAGQSMGNSMGTMMGQGMNSLLGDGSSGFYGSDAAGGVDAYTGAGGFFEGLGGTGGESMLPAIGGAAEGVGEALPAIGEGIAAIAPAIGEALPAIGEGIAEIAPAIAAIAAEGGEVKGKKVPALVSPGEQYLRPNDVKEVVKDGKDPLKVGEKIPGKPKHPGNDYRNDTVKKTLTEGGIVIPNKILQGPNPHWAAMRFVHATMAKNRHKGK